MGKSKRQRRLSASGIVPKRATHPTDDVSSEHGTGEPQMAVAGHVFADWVPPVQSVVAIDFCGALQMVAVGRRSTADVKLNVLELWSAKGLPSLHYLTSAVHPSCSLEALQLLSDGRLFAATATGALYEYHALSGLKEIRTLTVSASPIWALAKSPDEQTIACGLDNGHVALVDTSGKSAVVRKQLSLTFDRRAVSLAWHPDGRHLAVGSVDAIQVIAVDENLSATKRIRIDIDRKGRLDHVVVWSILFLRNFTIVAGDSRGRTSFWHATEGSLIAAGRVLATGIDPKLQIFSASILESHDEGVVPTGVLSSTSADKFPRHFSGSLRKRFVFLIISIICNAAALAARIARKRRASFSGVNDGRSLVEDPASVRWRPAGTKRVHTHDVRCMCRAGGYVLSAGVDGYIAVNSFRPPAALMHPSFGHTQAAAASSGAQTSAVAASVSRFKPFGGASQLPPATAAALHTKNGLLFTIDKQIVAVSLDETAMIFESDVICEDYGLLHRGLLHTVVISATLDGSGSQCAFLSLNGDAFVLHFGDVENLSECCGHLQLQVTAVTPSHARVSSVSVAWLGAKSTLAVLYDDFSLASFDVSTAGFTVGAQCLIGTQLKIPQILEYYPLE